MRNSSPAGASSEHCPEVPSPDLLGVTNAALKPKEDTALAHRASLNTWRTVSSHGEPLQSHLQEALLSYAELQDVQGSPVLRVSSA